MKRLLIVGQGIAGTALAIHLLNEDIDLTIIDDGHKSASTTIAGGIMDPISGRRLAQSIMQEEAFPYAIDWYKRLEVTLNTSFLTPLSIRRYLNDPITYSYYLKKRDKAPFNQLFESHFDHSDTTYPFTNTNGGIISSGYRLNFQQFLSASKEYLVNVCDYRTEAFSHDHLTHTATGVHYRGETFDHIIFCEGFRIKDNPFFNWLRYAHVKGDMFILDIPDLKCDELIVDSNWLLPLGNDKYMFGATYDRHNHLLFPSKAANQTLVDSLETLFIKPLTYRIECQLSGVRPSLSDFKPIAFRHPTLTHISVVNCYGSKGSIIAPYIAQYATDTLVHNKSEDPLLSRT
jgi:glycine/D-amino acid oxidase-like deaminating enzyme